MAFADSITDNLKMLQTETMASHLVMRNAVRQDYKISNDKANKHLLYSMPDKVSFVARVLFLINSQG